MVKPGTVVWIMLGFTTLLVLSGVVIFNDPDGAIIALGSGGLAGGLLERADRMRSANESDTE